MQCCCLCALDRLVGFCAVKVSNKRNTTLADGHYDPQKLPLSMRSQINHQRLLTILAHNARHLFAVIGQHSPRYLVILCLNGPIAASLIPQRVVNVRRRELGLDLDIDAVTIEAIIATLGSEVSRWDLAEVDV